ncbi:HAD family hydrolase [Halobacillus massiliensis]|uniref:HAD family hydrolase n=1 Tax=Halobacillus massiliensis TaxID=1926286 RepID=UPI0009E441A1|nr:HAD family hydrolase [Halobacillus massiliensis]
MDSIIFDLDGTIWDPIDTVLLAWNSHLEKSGERQLIRPDFEGTMGLQMDEIGRRLFPHLDDEERTQLISDACDIEEDFIKKHGGQLFPEVEAVLKELAGRYKLFIVSNCQDGYIEAFYEAHGLEPHFIDYENPGRTGLSKGENIQLIIDRNDLKDPVYVGDTEGDMNAARQAGIPFVYAKYGFGQVTEYDEVIENFNDLLKLY